VSHTATAGRPQHRGLITVSIMLATIMQAVDTTIANVALPHMQGSMSATSEQIAWVLTSYIVAAAIMTPMTGFLAARMGRKRLFVAASSVPAWCPCPSRSCWIPIQRKNMVPPWPSGVWG